MFKAAREHSLVHSCIFSPLWENAAKGGEKKLFFGHLKLINFTIEDTLCRGLLFSLIKFILQAATHGCYLCKWNTCEGNEDNDCQKHTSSSQPSA